MDHHATIPELLKAFPLTNSKLELAYCVKTLPRSKPRHYLIVPSSEMYKSILDAWAHFQKMKKEFRFQNDTCGVMSVNKIDEGLAGKGE
eukprot:scaffold2541_cov175-Amphora_coffeaeformis.AAC.11